MIPANVIKRILSNVAQKRAHPAEESRLIKTALAYAQIHSLKK